MNANSDYSEFWKEPGPDGCATLHDWARLALSELLAEGEGFSGKRPLGNSGWEGEFEDAIKKHNVKPIDHAVDWLIANGAPK